ncbi:MAG: GNAT family N-acetyltransferase [Malacoplasma sp.]
MKQILSVNDLKQIEEIESMTFGKNSYNLSELEYFNKNNLYNFYLIKENENIASYAITQETIDFIEIIKITTVANFRNKKYGTILLNRIKEESEKDIYIEVSDRDNTSEFYLKNKFTKIGFRRKYYIDSSNCTVMVFKKKNI